MMASGLPETYSEKMTKEEINRLPIKRWKGPIRLVREDEGIDDALMLIEGETVLGFDTETRPSFKKGVVHHPSLLQLASPEAVVIFQLKQLTVFDRLAALLSSERIFKVGVGLDNDVRQLQWVFPFAPGGFIDLGEAAQGVGMESRGLRSMAASLFGFRISKRAQCSNWEIPDLQSYQVTYAATDAWVSRQIYLAMAGQGLLPPENIAEGMGPPEPRPA